MGSGYSLTFMLAQLPDLAKVPANPDEERSSAASGLGTTERE